MYQSCGSLGSMATVPPSPVASWGQGVVDGLVEVAAVPFAPRPARSVPGSVGCWAKLTISAREPRLVLRLVKWVASSAEQTGACWLMPSDERQRPPSLAMKSRGWPLVARAAIACCAGATWAGEAQPLMELVVLRRVQPAAKEQRYTSDGACVEECVCDAGGGGGNCGEGEVVVSLIDSGVAAADFESYASESFCECDAAGAAGA